MTEHKFALLKYNTRNIGDEIQSIAARRFLPRVDYMLDRDHINDAKLEKKTKVILNGWFTHKPENWPINNDLIEPLFISFHISNEYGSSLEKLLNEESVAYYKKHEPIGTRDLSTLELLKQRGVNAYFSGCLTLTFEYQHKERNGKIYLVDVPENIRNIVPDNLKENISFLSHRKTKLSSEQRFEKAKEFLDLYSQAEMVITSRIHCAMPCIAFGTPVIFLCENYQDPRYNGLINLTRNCSIDDLMNGTVKINWDHPEANPIDIDGMRRQLIKTCEEFVKESDERF